PLVASAAHVAPGHWSWKALDERLERGLGREGAGVLPVVDGAGRAERGDGAVVGAQPGLLLDVLVERDGDGRDDGDDRDDDHQLDERHTLLVPRLSEPRAPLLPTRKGSRRRSGRKRPTRMRAPEGSLHEETMPRAYPW